jgi:putative DNA methylase
VATRKLIEVALPLEAINRASAREKSIRHGHPSTLHLWWARRPLAACRAVLFASIVDDPSSRPDLYSEESADRERQRLLDLVERLVTWEATTDEKLLQEVRAEIRRSVGGSPPPILDPFCGGGSIPLEAQRLGLEAFASDLNPVAVLITRALVEIPSRFAGVPPVRPEPAERLAAREWVGAAGLSEDVRHYGRWMRDRAAARIGASYPEAALADGSAATVVAWIWARTATCPNPACGAEMALVSSFLLCAKADRRAWLEPIVDRDASTVDFQVRTGAGPPPPSPKLGRGARFRCLVCGEAAPEDYIKAQGAARQLGIRLMAIVAAGSGERIYLAPSSLHSEAAKVTRPTDVPSGEIAKNPRWFSPPLFGMTEFSDLFTNRQLLALTTFSDLVAEVRDQVLTDAGAAGHDAPEFAREYADAVATLLALAVDRGADAWSSLVGWRTGVEATRGTFARQALAMVWDFAEANPFSSSSGNWLDACVGWVAEAIETAPAGTRGVTRQLDATAAFNGVEQPLVCTDPPYYDNIGYAELSDFFYVWLRRALRDSYPQLFSTLLTPKTQELIAVPYRFGGSKASAQRHFETGLHTAFARIYEKHSRDYPMTLFYAFKQAESDKDGVASTGWETMLEGLLGAGFSVTGTWPMRTERGGRSVAIGTAALASSIVLVCRHRPDTAPLATRREFMTALRAELPTALRALQQGSIAPVDLAQAAIGPGMSIFSRNAKVVEADGTAMTVRAALATINHALDEILAEQEGDFDPDTRFAITWFGQYGMDEGAFGDADVLARAKNTSVGGMVAAEVVVQRGSKVRLRRRDELLPDWDPAFDSRLSTWEAVQHLVRRLENAGEVSTAALLRRLGGDLGERAKELAYQLFSICDRKGWASEAVEYNALVVAWPEIVKQVVDVPETEPQQEFGI